MSNDGNIHSRHCVDVAKTYLDKGLSIIPIKAKSKEPKIEKWKPYQSSYPEKKDLVSWFSNSDTNIAIVTGKISAIFAIDIDGEEAAGYYNNKINSCGDEQLISANKNTMKIKTGSGNINIIFGFNTEEYVNKKLKSLTLWRGNDKNNHSEIRVKGENSYIVAPPSIHPNNNEYTLVNGINPINLKREQIHKLIDLFSKDDINRDKKSTKSILQIVEILKPHYSDGLRNDLVLYLSGWLRKLGIPLETAEEIITELAKDDEEKYNRIKTLHETYKKQDLEEIAGYSGLLKILTYECSEDDAKEKLTKVKEIIDKKFGTNKNNKKEKKEEEIDIISLIKEDYCKELFVEQFNKPYIAIKIKEHVENLGLDSQRFKNWLFRFFYENTGDLSSEQVENVIKVLKSKAEFNENRKKLELRVAKSAAATDVDDYTFYYDLTNSNWSAVKITSQGWSIEENPPILFRRYSNQLPQFIPVKILEADKKNEDNNILDKFVNLLNIKDDDNKLLLKCYIVSLFIPDISKPILMLHGEQGSAKSTLQELIKILVDPSIVRILTFPKDINELIQQLSHNYIAYFDNVSIIKEWISNALCRGVNGSGFSKRQLYTDDDDIIYNFKRCLGFNGINLGATKADLLDRGIIIQLERISKERRRKLKDIWKEFEILRPQLLGYIFDILVKVLQIKQNGGITIPNGLNRMADFEEYAEIISRCMGYSENEFLRVYQKNIDIQIEEAIEASPLSVAVIGLFDSIQDDELQKGMTATELLAELNNYAETELKMNISKIRSWPKSSNALSRRLNEIVTVLREKGIVIERYKDEKGNRLIKIRNISSIPPYRQELKNQEQNLDKCLDDTLDDTKKISSIDNTQNQAQNNGFGRFDDIDDTLHVKVKEHFAKGKSLGCHHKNCNGKEFHSLEAYNNHCHSKHPKQPMYPESSLIERMELKLKGNPWEAQ